MERYKVTKVRGDDVSQDKNIKDAVRVELTGVLSML